MPSEIIWSLRKIWWNLRKNMPMGSRKLEVSTARPCKNRSTPSLWWKMIFWPSRNSIRPNWHRLRSRTNKCWRNSKIQTKAASLTSRKTSSIYNWSTPKQSPKNSTSKKYSKAKESSWPNSAPKMISYHKNCINNKEEVNSKSVRITTYKTNSFKKMKQ